MAAKAQKRGDALMQLANIGSAMRRDLAILGIDSVRQLAECDADELYLRLNERSGCRQDPCVCDVFAAAIHEARTGEATPWWQWTAERKRRHAAGSFRN
jgi:hypothetical protein